MWHEPGSCLLSCPIRTTFCPFSIFTTLLLFLTPCSWVIHHFLTGFSLSHLLLIQSFFIAKRFALLKYNFALIYAVFEKHLASCCLHIKSNLKSTLVCFQLTHTLLPPSGPLHSQN